jgi:hypothetical protein
MTKIKFYFTGRSENQFFGKLNNLLKQALMTRISTYDEQDHHEKKNRKSNGILDFKQKEQAGIKLWVSRIINKRRNYSSY